MRESRKWVDDPNCRGNNSDTLYALQPHWRGIEYYYSGTDNYNLTRGEYNIITVALTITTSLEGNIILLQWH